MMAELLASQRAVGSGVKIPPHQRCTLDNGIRLILLPLDEVPLIAFEAVLRGGARFDPPAREGVAALTGELLKYGSGELDAYAFADAVEGAGGSLDIDTHSEAIHVHGQFLAQDLELLLTLLADALQRSHLPASELDKLRKRRIEFIRAAKDSEPQSLIGTYGRALLFAHHPYGKPTAGSETSLLAITREDVLRLYRQQLGADRLTLVLAGDFDPEWLKSAVARSFGAWRCAEASLPPLMPPERAQGRRVLLIDSPGSEQSYLWFANVGVPRAYPLSAALEVVNTAFGGKFGSMLMQALRVKTGLTYSVATSLRRGSVAGEFSISTFTQTASTARAIEIVLETLTTLRQHGIGEEAIASARSYVLGQYPLGFETASDWVLALAKLDLYDLPDSYIDDFGPALQRVDAAEAMQVVATAFTDSTALDIVVIGDAAKIRREVASFGPLIEKSLAEPNFSVN